MATPRSPRCFWERSRGPGSDQWDKARGPALCDSYADTYPPPSAWSLPVPPPPDKDCGGEKGVPIYQLWACALGPEGRWSVVTLQGGTSWQR